MLNKLKRTLKSRKRKRSKGGHSRSSMVDIYRLKKEKCLLWIGLSIRRLRRG
jgi:hypothetical protein